MFLRKGVLKRCSIFTREHLCQSVISIRLQRNFTEITLGYGCSPENLLHIFRTPLEGCFCNAVNVITTNIDEKRTVDQNKKNPTTSESFDDAQTTKSRMKWNYGQTSIFDSFLEKQYR